MKKIQKTLVVLALTAMTGTSFAEVVLYGQIRGGVEVSQTKVGSQKANGTTTQIVDLGSRIGFKGHEHLSGNTKAIWQLEQSVNIGGGEGTRFGSRTSFVGLEGDFGRVRAGWLSSPVHDRGGDIDDFMYDNAATGLAKFTRKTDANQRRVAVDYFTPDMGGFKASAYVSPSDNNSTTGRDSAVYGVGAYFDKGAISTNVVGTYVKNGANNLTGKDAYQVVAQGFYDMGKFNAGLAYQYTKNVEAARVEGHEVAALVGFKPADNLKVKVAAAYGFNNKVLNAAGQSVKNKDDVYYQGIVGAEYHLSKRTETFAQVGYLQEGKGAGKTRTVGSTVGIRHRF